mmetsp:Transcript_6405/g.10777  ORF Transcript_6405/g.10777 Transcript_6405/m.10777 type:complete len:314 (+) Transcript_6405:105-1046(+)
MEGSSVAMPTVYKDDPPTKKQITFARKTWDSLAHRSINDRSLFESVSDEASFSIRKVQETFYHNVYDINPISPLLDEEFANSKTGESLRSPFFVDLVTLILIGADDDSVFYNSCVESFAKFYDRKGISSVEFQLSGESLVGAMSEACKPTVLSTSVKSTGIYTVAEDEEDDASLASRPAAAVVSPGNKNNPSRQLASILADPAADWSRSDITDAWSRLYSKFYRVLMPALLLVQWRKDLKERTQRQLSSNSPTASPSPSGRRNSLTSDPSRDQRGGSSSVRDDVSLSDRSALQRLKENCRKNFARALGGNELE